MEDYNLILNKIKNIESKINISPDIKLNAIDDVRNIIAEGAQPISRENFGRHFFNTMCSLKVEPMSYVDETKFYTYRDAAYKIYEQLLAQKDKKYSAMFANIIAMSALIRWTYYIILNETISGLKVEAYVDEAIRGPITFAIKNFSFIILQIIAIIGPSYYLGQYNSGKRMTIMYIVLMIITYIRFAIQIMSHNKNKDKSTPITKI